MVKRKVALAFADTSCHGSDEDKNTANRKRRSRRSCRNTKTTEPSNISDSGDDIDFVDEMPVVPAGVAAAAVANISKDRMQRQQQRHESKNQQQQYESKNENQQPVQRDEEALRQQEENDLMRAIALSKLEMEANKSRSDSQEDWVTEDDCPLEAQQHVNESQAAQLPRKSLSSKGSGAVDGSPGQGLHENKLQSRASSSTSQNSIPKEIKQSSQEHFTEWQDLMESEDWEDPSVQKGVETSDRGTPNIHPKDITSLEPREDRHDTTSSNQDYAEDDWLTSNKSPPESRRSRLRLRKRPDVSPQSSPPSRMRKVPLPPDIASLDELDNTFTDKDEPEEIDMTRDESSGDENSQEGMEEERQDLEVIELVDTRKPCHQKHPYFAPENGIKYTYTKAVYQLIQAYCCRLRRAQAKVLTSAGWGQPVVTGNCYHDTLVLRKRGRKGFTFYALSDSDEEEMAGTVHQDKGTLPKEGEAPAKKRLSRQKKKSFFTDDADSDFDGFVSFGQSKIQGRRKLSAPDAVEMLNMEEKEKERIEPEEKGIVTEEEESLSQTLLQDLSETEDFCAAQKEAIEYDSDRSRPVNRTPRQTPKHCSPNGRDLSPLVVEEGSQGSTTDIFEVSTIVESDAYQTSQSSSKDTNVSRQQKTASQDTEKDSDVDSFDEQLLSLSFQKTPQSSSNAASPTVNNHSQTRPVAVSKEVQSSDSSKSRNSKMEDQDTAENYGFGEKLLVSSVPADSSQTGEDLENSSKVEESRTRELSFEEIRFYHEGLREMADRRQEDSPLGQNIDELQPDEVQEANQSEDSHNEQLILEKRTQKQEGIKGKLPMYKNRSTMHKEEETINKGALNPQASATSSVDLTKHKESNHQKVHSGGAVGEKEWQDSEGGQTDEDSGEDHCDEEEDGEGARDDDDEHKKSKWLGDGRKVELRGRHINVEDNDGDVDDEDVEDGDVGDEDDDVEDGDNEVGYYKDNIDRQEENREILSEHLQEDSRTDGDNQELVNEAYQGINISEDGIDGVDDAADEDQVEDSDNSVIGVQCPLCDVQFPIDQIEAHASGCNGPTSARPVEEDNYRYMDNSERPEPSGGDGWRRTQPKREDHVVSINQTNAFNEDSPGTSTAGDRSRRGQVKYTGEGVKPVRGIATKILKDNSIPGQQGSSTSVPLSPNKMSPIPMSDEDNSESFSESTDHLNATLFQIVEDNNLYHRKRKRTVDRPAKRQRPQEGDKRDESKTGVEDTEPCFICNKRIPKSLYAEHVQDEIDRAEKKMPSQVAAQPRLGLRSKGATSKAAGIETSRE